MVHRILAVALMTFRRLLRSRILIAGAILALLVMGLYSGILIAILAAADQGDEQGIAALLPMFFHLAVTMFGTVSTMMAVIIGVNVLRTDLTGGTVFGVLSKPVSRGEYVAGNWLGGLVAVLMLWIVFALAMAAIASGIGSPLGSLHVAIIGSRILVAALSLSAALLLSIRFNPWVAAVLSVLLVNGASVVEQVANILRVLNVDVPEPLVNALVFPFPITGAFEGLNARLMRSDLAPASVFPAVAHFVDYALVLIVLAYLSFRRLDLNRSSE